MIELPINLEGLTDFELLKLQNDLCESGELDRSEDARIVDQVSVEIAKRYGVDTEELSLLIGLAGMILTARSHRLYGYIEDALHVERIIDAIYSELPKQLRW